MSYVIGVTGGVGAGKSKVLSMLQEEFGVEVILADEVGRRLMEPEGACFQSVVELFGSEIVREDGTLDRQKIASVVFRDKEQLNRLNALIHPAVKAEISQSCRESKAAVVAVETAILFEAHYEDICDEIWYIYADEATRRQRLKESRGYSQQKIDEVMGNQLSEAEFRRKCDRIIDNSRGLEETKNQIKAALADRITTG